MCVCVSVCFFGQARLACNRGVLSIPCEEAARIAEAFRRHVLVVDSTVCAPGSTCSEEAARGG